MERVCREADGLFPTPKEIKMSCSCPDWAGMCKHVAATLYGVGARLDRDPDVLFTLRGVDRSELVSTGADLSITEAAAASERVLAGDDIAALFGLEIETPVASPKHSRRKANGARPDVGSKPSVGARKPKANENAGTRRKAARTRAAEARRAAKTRATSKPAGLATGPAPTALEEKTAVPAAAKTARGGGAKTRRGAGGTARADRAKPKAGRSGDQGATPSRAAAKPSTRKPKASAPVGQAAAATAKRERATAAKAAADASPQREATAKSADVGDRFGGRTRVAKWIGARARKAGRR